MPLSDAPRLDFQRYLERGKHLTVFDKVLYDFVHMLFHHGIERHRGRLRIENEGPSRKRFWIVYIASSRQAAG
jgi:hypothetical protein